MRDLKADIKAIKANPAVWCELPRSIIIEYVERAIFAEDCMERRQTACGDWMKKCEELESTVAALTEKNDIQRESIQALSGQVTALREGIEKVVYAPDYTHRLNAAIDELPKLLSSPDPGEKIRTVIRMAKNLDEALSRLPDSDKIEVTEGRIQFMVAAMALQKALWNLEGGD